MKTIFYIFITIILAICLIYFSTSLVDNEVIAATGSSTSDVQLIAKPLIGEARGESYEGQVAVRCSYIK